MSNSQRETKSGSAAPAVVIPQLNQAQRTALQEGRTIKHYSNTVQPQKKSLRQRAMYDDERLSDGGDALNTARTMGVLRGIHEVGQHRAAAAPVIRAIGRRNLAHSVGYPFVRGYKDFQDTDKHILGFAGEEKIPISDLTKTFLGAPSKRKGKTRKDPRTEGGRRRKRRKPKRKRKRKRTKKFRKGSKSKTHKGKNFETRKTSKNYNSKRWKRMTGRRTRKAPLFPFV